VSAPAALLAVLLAVLPVQDGAPPQARAALARGDCERALLLALDGLGDGASAAELAFLESVLRDPRHVRSTTSDRAWQTLARHPHAGRTTLVNPGEPGQALVVSGVVRDAAGAPLADAVLHLFQTDATGHYTPTKVMDEPHARLMGWLATDAEGRFEFTTIRPGGYPGTPERRGVDWEIPSHVHFVVTHPGHAARAFQMVFDDDPRMRPERWRRWAVEGHLPVVPVTRDETNVQRATLVITLDPAGG